MKKWSSQWTQFMQLRKEAWKKNQDFNGVWTRDLAITGATHFFHKNLAQLVEHRTGNREVKGLFVTGWHKLLSLRRLFLHFHFISAVYIWFISYIIHNTHTTKQKRTNNGFRNTKNNPAYLSYPGAHNPERVTPILGRCRGVFTVLVLLTGLWNLKDIQHSRQNRSKNKLVLENAVTRALGSCSLRVVGYWSHKCNNWPQM